MNLTVREHRRRGHHPGANPGLEVAPHPLSDRVGSAICVEALEVQSQSTCPRPKMRILEPRLVCEQQVVHVPEPPLAARRLGRAGGGPGPRMARPDREMAEYPAKRQVPEPLTQDRAVR